MRRSLGPIYIAPRERKREIDDASCAAKTTKEREERRLLGESSYRERRGSSDALKTARDPLVSFFARFRFPQKKKKNN